MWVKPGSYQGGPAVRASQWVWGGWGGVGGGGCVSLELFMRVGMKPPVGVLPYGPARGGVGRCGVLQVLMYSDIFMRVEVGDVSGEQGSSAVPSHAPLHACAHAQAHACTCRCTCIMFKQVFAACCLSGTGKTLLARAIASNIDANFLKVRAGFGEVCEQVFVAGTLLGVATHHIHSCPLPGPLPATFLTPLPCLTTATSYSGGVIRHCGQVHWRVGTCDP